MTLFRIPSFDEKARWLNHFSVFHPDGNLPLIFIHDGANIIGKNHIIWFLILVKQRHGRLQLFPHFLCGIAFEECDHLFVPDTGFRFRKMNLEPFINGDKQFFFLVAEPVIPDQVPAKAEHPFGVLGNIGIFPSLNSHVAIVHLKVNLLQFHFAKNDTA